MKISFLTGLSFHVCKLLVNSLTCQLKSSYLPFSICSFKAAKASMSPSVVEAA